MRLQVRERYPMNGEERQHRRRDLRKGEAGWHAMSCQIGPLLLPSGSHPALHTLSLLA